MIVGPGSKAQSKGHKKKKGLSVIEKAKAALKRAVLDGTLRELLWKELSDDDNDEAMTEGVPESGDEIDNVNDQSTDIVVGEGSALNYYADTNSWNGFLSRTTIMKSAEERKSMNLQRKRQSTKAKNMKEKGSIEQSQSTSASIEHEAERDDGNDAPVPRMRGFSQIMHKLKSAALATKFMHVVEDVEEVDSEASEVLEPELSLPVQRDDDEILWAGVMGVSLDDSSTVLSGYPSDVSTNMVVELFNMSNELRQQRETKLHARRVKVSEAEPGSYDSGHKPLTQEEDLKNKLEERYIASRRALLRLHCNTAQYPLPRPPPSAVEFSQFWNAVLIENRKFAPSGMYERFPAAAVGHLEIPTELHAPVVAEETEALEDGSRPASAESQHSQRDEAGGSEHLAESGNLESFVNDGHWDELSTSTRHQRSVRAHRQAPRHSADRLHTLGIESDADVRRTTGLRDLPNEQYYSDGSDQADIAQHEALDSGEDESDESASSSENGDASAQAQNARNAGTPRKRHKRRKKKGALTHRHTTGSRSSPGHTPRIVAHDRDPSSSGQAESAGSAPGSQKGPRAPPNREPHREPHHYHSKRREPHEREIQHAHEQGHVRADHAIDHAEYESDHYHHHDHGHDRHRIPHHPFPAVHDKHSISVPSSSTKKKGHRTKISPERSADLGDLSASESGVLTDSSTGSPKSPPQGVSPSAPRDRKQAQYNEQDQQRSAYEEPKFFDNGRQRYSEERSQRAPDVSNRANTHWEHSRATEEPSFPVEDHDFTVHAQPVSSRTAGGAVESERREDQHVRRATHLRRLLSPTSGPAAALPRLAIGYEHLRGIWPYDPSLDAFRVLYQLSRSRRRQGWASARARAMRQQKREFAVLQTQSSRIAEVSFDPRSMTLVLTTYLEDVVHTRESVSLHSVYLTESVVADMLTLRTHDTNSIPTGYLGTYSISQWNAMSREINAALAQYALLTPTARRAVSDNLSQLSRLSAEVAGASAVSQLASESTAAQNAVERNVNSGLSNRAVVFSDDVEQPSSHLSDLLSAHPPAHQVFLTEPQLQALMPGGELDAHVEQDVQQDEEVSRSELQHLADQGYAAYHELSELYPFPARALGVYDAVERPPRVLNIPMIQASVGPVHSLVLEGPGPPQSPGGSVVQKGASKRRQKRKVHIPTDLDVQRVDNASRFMDLIRDAVTMYKQECARYADKMAATATSLANSATAELSEHSTFSHITEPSLITAAPEARAWALDERKLQRYYDPLSLHHPIDAGYVATGFAAQGDAVQFSITGVQPYSPTPSMVGSPSPPKQPRHSTPRIRPWTNAPGRGDDTTRGAAGSGSRFGGSSKVVYLDSQLPALMSGERMLENSVNSLEFGSGPAALSSRGEGFSLDLTAPTTPAASTQPRSAGVRRINIDHRSATPKTPAGGHEALKIVMLVEGRDSTQIFFAKKFLQLDHVVDALSTLREAVHALQENGPLYRLILVNYAFLFGPQVEQKYLDLWQASLAQLRSHTNGLEGDQASKAVVVYNLPNKCSAETLRSLQSLGVSVVLREPYTTASLKEILRAQKQQRAQIAVTASDLTELVSSP